MINATPNMNGNSEKDFVEAAVRLSQAVTAVEEALANIRSNVFHGRNYQTIPDWQHRAARSGDDLQMEYAQKDAQRLHALAKQIMDKALADAV